MMDARAFLPVALSYQGDNGLLVACCGSRNTQLAHIVSITIPKTLLTATYQLWHLPLLDVWQCR
jgi:hypothetical protein